MSDIDLIYNLLFYNHHYYNIIICTFIFLAAQPTLFPWQLSSADVTFLPILIPMDF